MNIEEAHKQVMKKIGEMTPHDRAMAVDLTDTFWGALHDWTGEGLGCQDKALNSGVILTAVTFLMERCIAMFEELEPE